MQSVLYVLSLRRGGKVERLLKLSRLPTTLVGKPVYLPYVMSGIGHPRSRVSAVQIPGRWGPELVAGSHRPRCSRVRMDENTDEAFTICIWQARCEVT
jgi:hypothetical protein